jgi:hypothetical protein
MHEFVRPDAAVAAHLHHVEIEVHKYITMGLL